MDGEARYSISVVIPCFNEERSIGELHRQLTVMLDEHARWSA